MVVVVGGVEAFLTNLHMVVAVVIVFVVVIVVSLTHLHMVELGGCGGWGCTSIFDKPPHGDGSCDSIHAKSGRYLRYISANFFGFSAKF